jgi:aconitate hydratase
VLSGNRNFEGRIHPEVKMNYLASPPLVVAYAIAGRMDADLVNEPLGEDPDGNPVYLKDIWPDEQGTAGVHRRDNVSSEMFPELQERVRRRRSLEEMDTPTGEMFAWDDDSTYVQNPPYFEGMTWSCRNVPTSKGARVLAKLADSVTTDHISPAGSHQAGLAGR